MAPCHPKHRWPAVSATKSDPQGRGQRMPTNPWNPVWLGAKKAKMPSKFVQYHQQSWEFKVGNAPPPITTQPEKNKAFSGVYW